MSPTVWKCCRWLLVNPCNMASQAAYKEKLSWVCLYFSLEYHWGALPIYWHHETLQYSKNVRILSEYSRFPDKRTCKCIYSNMYATEGDEGNHLFWSTPFKIVLIYPLFAFVVGDTPIEKRCLSTYPKASMTVLHIHHKVLMEYIPHQWDVPGPFIGYYTNYTLVN